jgi:hypothetical protein
MAPQTRVKERAEEQSSSMTADQQAAIRMVANDLHRLNQSVPMSLATGPAGPFSRLYCLPGDPAG